MSRIDANDLATRVADLRLQLDELKTAQRIGGASLVLQLNSSAAAYDIATSSLPAGAQTLVVPNFTSDTQIYPYVDLTFRVFMDTTTNEVRPGMTGYPRVTIYQFIAGAEKITVWTLRVTNTTGVAHTYYFKFYIQSTDSGVIS